MTSGYVYVILLRECISQGLHIFKIGRTTDIFTRYKAYPKGSKLLLLHYVDNCVQAEKDIIQSLKSSTLMQKTEYGSEYFEGPFLDLFQIVYQCSISAREKNADTNYIFRLPQTAPSQQTLDRYAAIEHKTEAIPDEKNAENTQPCETQDVQATDDDNRQDQSKIKDTSVSPKTPPTQYVKEFLDEKKDIFEGKVVKLGVLYDALCGWLQEKNRPRVNQRTLTKCIKDDFDIVPKSHRFPDGIHQAYDFTRDENIDHNFLRFVEENIQEKEQGFFTLQQAKKVYMEKDYCSFQLKNFKDQLEKQLDTICIDKKYINGKIWNSVFLGYELNKTLCDEASHNKLCFFDSCIIQTKYIKDFISLKEIKECYRKSQFNKYNINIEKQDVEKKFNTECVPQKKIKGGVKANVFCGLKLKCDDSNE